MLAECAVLQPSVLSYKTRKVLMEVNELWCRKLF